MNYNRLVTLNYTTELKPATLYSSYLTAYTLHMALLHNRVTLGGACWYIFEKNGSKIVPTYKIRNLDR